MSAKFRWHCISVWSCFFIVPLISHLHNKRNEPAFYMECKVFKRTETFRGSGYSLKADGKSKVYNTNLYCITEQAE